MAAALTVGTLLLSVARAADDSQPQDNRPWYKRMFSAPKPVPTESTVPVARNGAVAAPPGQQPISKPLSPEAVSAALQAEQAAYLRRLNVCVELRKAAEERNDNVLRMQVDEFERQAEAIYKQRVSSLGLSKTVRAPLPNSNAGFAASFDLAPEKPIEPKAAAAKLIAPAAPVPTGSAAPITGSAEVREVKP